MKRLTPVVAVDDIAPALEFWVERLGFEKTAEVPHGDGLGFVILEKGAVQVMYQTWASIADDIPALVEEVTGHAASMFVEVSDLDEVEAALEGLEITLPRRTTFYGMEEIGVREPGGHLVVFAQSTGQ
jgi:uncharacterized glyoxalase superfamily protein PhnB